MNEKQTPVSSRRYWPLGQLVLARLREFLREPEAVFWVYGFPIVMTVVLGIAFRNKPVERVHVDVADGPAAASVKDVLSSQEKLQVEIHDLDSCRQRLRTGKVELAVVPATTEVGSSAGSGGRPSYE